jgi:hypothetical protein
MLPAYSGKLLHLQYSDFRFQFSKRMLLPNVRQAMRVNHEQARMNESQGRRADLRGTKATYSLLLTRCDVSSLTGSLC